MNTTNIFNEETNQWETIEVDDYGFPLTEERIKQLEEIENVVVEENVILKENIIPGRTSFQFADSWVQKEDGWWYSPVEYPSLYLGEYIWDELEGEWLATGYIWNEEAEEFIRPGYFWDETLSEWVEE